MKIPLACFLLLFPHVLSQDPSVTQRYRKFIAQHIKVGMDRNRCDGEMQKRRITQTGSNLCKTTNTFIQAQINLIRHICLKAGEPYGEMRASLKPFPVVVCKLRNQDARVPHCQYRGNAYTTRIAIKCEQGLPVHYDRGVVVLDNNGLV